MKFVRQTDWSASHRDDEGKECWIPPHYVEEPLVQAWLVATARHGTPMTVEDAPDGAFFDPGGMVFEDEPRVEVVVNGQKLGCWLRGADTLVPVLRRECRWAEGFAGPPHCLVRGRYKNVLLTLETARAAADVIEAEANRRAAECDAAQAARDDVLAQADVMDRMVEKNPVAAVVQGARRAANSPAFGPERGPA